MSAISTYSSKTFEDLMKMIKEIPERYHSVYLACDTSREGYSGAKFFPGHSRVSKSSSSSLNTIIVLIIINKRVIF